MSEISKTGKPELDQTIKEAIEKLGYTVTETKETFQTTKKEEGKK